MLSQSQTQSHGSSDVSKQSRALTGTVTKLLDNFGFIDDSVFFQLSVVKGGDVQVGDKVYCECSFSEHLPFKWNATKVHLVQTSGRGTGAQSIQSGPPSAASQVATTYLQHRLQQQQQQQQSREDPAPMSGIVNSSHNYYSSQSVSNTTYGSQQSFDFSKAQQAVAAAQQLANYYGTGRAETNSFSQLQYTSTPGSAFVSSTLPFTQQIQQNLLSTQPRTAATNSYKSSASRWEREDRSGRTDDKFRSREPERARNVDTGRKRNDSRDRNVNGREGRDEFGRDLRAGDKTKDRERDREREREREREKLEKERERRYKRSVSPTSSISSHTAIARVRRRPYEPVNIPKLAILKTPLNVYDIKQRYSANLHIPSDLKEVIINANFSLNINEIPKPITFRVIEVKDKKKETPKKPDSPKESSEKNGSKDETEATKPDVIEIEDNNKTDTKEKEKTSTVEHPISQKQTYKYGVKVLLISVPSLAEIYERMFGSDFDAVPTGTKSYFLHFNKLLSFLVTRNSNDGFSLIGGKFSPQIDGYLPDSEEPNLIATAIRIVGEQTGMNLSKCGKWRLIATFIYNRDSSVDPMTPNLELNRVYMPDVWSAFDGIYETLKTNKNINELENDNQIVLTNDNIENNSEVIVSTIEKIESISAEDNNNTNDSAIEEVAKDSPPAGVDPSSDSNTAMDLSQTDPNIEANDTDSQPMDSSVPIVETTATVETQLPSSDAIDLTATSEDPVVEPTVVDTPPETRNDDSSSAPKEDSDLLNASVVTNNESVQETDISCTAASVEKLSSGEISELQELLLRINDLKVTELRAEIEKRANKLKGNYKKADLINKLRQIITKLLEDEDVVSDENKNDWWAQRILSKEGTTNEANENSQEVAIDAKALEDKVIDEDAILRDDSGINETFKETNDSNDVVMNETENESKDFEVVDKVKTEEQMVVDHSEDLTQDTIDDTQDKPDNSEDNKDSQPEVKDKDSEEKTAQNGGAKRKSDSESPPKEPKKAKNGGVVQEIIPTKVTDGCVYVKGSENLTVITLHEALNHQRYDQFEMSIASEVIRESLIHHFSHSILSTLVFNHKNPLSKEEKATQELKTPLAVNYVHLSFAYFDSNHCGHILAEDLARLLNNSNFTLSRKAFNLMINSEDKVQYRDLLEPKELIPITKSNVKSGSQESNEESKQISAKIYERSGTIYDIEQLIEQSESSEKLKVRLNEELAANKEKISQLNEYIQELESRQKKMTIATEKQNDEICALKREREITKNKYDSMRKAVETSVSAFSKLLDKEKDEKEKEKEKEDNK